MTDPYLWVMEDRPTPRPRPKTRLQRLGDRLVIPGIILWVVTYTILGELTSAIESRRRRDV